MKTQKGAEVQKGADLGAVHQEEVNWCRGASPYIGGAAPCTSPYTRRHQTKSRQREPDPMPTASLQTPSLHHPRSIRYPITE